MSARLHAVPAEPVPAVGYIRVSKAREEMISPEIQQDAIERWAARNHRRIIRWVEDLDATGRNFMRAGIQAAISLVEDRTAKEIIVWRYSRFGRDRYDVPLNLHRVESIGGQLQSATEEVDAATAYGRFSRDMTFAVNAMESDRIGEGWQETHARRAAKGLPHNGNPRLGYLYTPGVGYRIDPLTGPLVRAAYLDYLAGASMQSLGRRFGRNGSSMATYLDSGFAAGLLHYKRTDEFRPGAHEALVTGLVWKRYVAARRLGRVGRSKASGVPRYPLSTLIVCPGCGKRLHLTQIKRYAYYKCSSRRACPVRASVRADDAERQMYGWLLALAADIDAETTRVRQGQDSRAAAASERKSLMRESTRLATALANLTVQLANGVVPEAAYVEARDQMLAEQAEVRRRLDTLTLHHAPARLPANLARDFPRMDADTQRALYRSLLDHVDLDGKTLLPVPHWASP